MAFENYSVQLTGDASGIAAAAARGTAAIRGYGGVVGQVAGTVARSAALMQFGLVGALAAITLGLKSTIGEAIEFEVQMRNANSIMHQSEVQFEATSDAILDLSEKVPQTAQQLAKGLYDVASSGFQGADGLQVLEAAAIAASAGMTDTATSARAITAVLNAYGLTATDAAGVSDTLFQTVNLGVITFEELAQQLGDVVGRAAAAKIPIEDVGAAIAAMTLAGVTPAEAFTSLNRVIGSIIDPSEDMLAVLNALGYESGALALSTDGLHTVMEKLRIATGGNVETMFALFKEERAVRGAFALMSAEGDNYRKTQEGIGEANNRNNATQEAYKEQLKATGNQLRLFGNQIQRDLIDAGKKALPAVLDVAKALRGFGEGLFFVLRPLGSVLSFLLEHREILEVLAVLYGIHLARAVATLLVQLASAAWGKIALGLVQLVAAATPARLALAGAGLAIAAFAVSAVQNFQQAQAAANEFKGELKEGVDESTLDGLSELARRTAQAREELEFEPGAGGSLGDAFRSIVLDSLPFIDTGVTKAEALRRANEEVAESASKMRANLVENLQRVSRETGLPIRRLDEFAKKAGIDLTKAVQSSGPERQKLIDYARSVAAEYGITTEQLAEYTQEQIEGFKKIEESAEDARKAFEKAFDLFSEFEPILPEEQAENIKDAANDLAAARERVADADERIRQNQRYLSRTPERDRELARLQADRAKAMSDLAEAEQKYGKALEDNVPVAQQLEKFLEKQVEDGQKFLTLLEQAAETGVDPEFLRKAIEAGPQEAIPILEALVSDHSGRLVGLVNKNEAAIREMSAQVAEYARLTTKAINSETDQLARDLPLAMKIARENMAREGKGFSTEIAKALGVPTEDVLRVAKEFGITLGDNIADAAATQVGEQLQTKIDEYLAANPDARPIIDVIVRPALDPSSIPDTPPTYTGLDLIPPEEYSRPPAAPAPPPPKPKPTQAPPGMPGAPQVGQVAKSQNGRSYMWEGSYWQEVDPKTLNPIYRATGMIHAATGMTTGSTVAHIATRQSVIYAEPGTGGEAFIPLGAGNRARSLSITEQVAGMFGYQLVPMARGGILSRPTAGAAGGYSTSNQFAFNIGTLGVRDPREFMDYADRKRRLAVLQGDV